MLKMCFMKTEKTKILYFHENSDLCINKLESSSDALIVRRLLKYTSLERCLPKMSKVCRMSNIENFTTTSENSLKQI